MTPSAIVPLPYTPGNLVDRLGREWARQLTEAYRWMVFARTLDSRMLGLQRQGRIGFYGPATGQEAVSVAAGLVSTRPDWIVPGLREQLVALMRGHSLSTYVNHLFANDRDPARGRQMPCHPTAREVHYVSMSSVIGTQITHAVGLAYSFKLKKDPSVAFAFFGDGATSSNDFHAGLNFAGVFGLPVLFCCTNNQWAISVPVERQSRVARLADKSAEYGFPGRRVDGTDVVACISEMRAAAARVREGHGPELLEFVLYRMTPHSSSDDPKRYQAADWMERAEAHDPMARLEALLLAHRVLQETDLPLFRDEAEGKVKRAIAEAEAVPPPAPESLALDVTASTRSLGG
ncbi:MAG TPA: thiamine pyrophosphate-dependent enzyme [Thermoplasmata archaeon]|nr:thiamine pyrophosphate-dependent enzyme [Thermoplasmata archaeon]